MMPVTDSHVHHWIPQNEVLTCECGFTYRFGREIPPIDRSRTDDEYRMAMIWVAVRHHRDCICLTCREARRLEASRFTTRDHDDSA